MMKINWRIYYIDDTTYDDTNGTWEDAPSDGIMCVVVLDPNYGRFVLNGLNYYYKPEDAASDDVAHCNDIVPNYESVANG